MPEKEPIRRARLDAAEGKAPTTQAGEFVKEEMEHIRKGKHGRPVYQAGDCYRSFQGAPGRRAAATT